MWEVEQNFERYVIVIFLTKHRLFFFLFHIRNCVRKPARGNTVKLENVVKAIEMVKKVGHCYCHQAVSNE